MTLPAVAILLAVFVPFIVVIVLLAAGFNTRTRERERIRNLEAEIAATETDRLGCRIENCKIVGEVGSISVGGQP